VDIIKKSAAPYGDAVTVKVYYAGRDFDYLKKYGMINKGTMIVNGRKKYQSLSPAIIRQAIEQAVRG
jgi:hypothetical protein